MKRRAGWVVAAVLLGATGCASPVQVVQIETLDAEARGIRYALRRPSYGVGLQHLGTACDFRVVVVTKLDARRYYEVRRPPWYALPLHAFSNTTVSVVLDDEGALTSANLKEQDQALEFVQAVAALAVKGAAMARAPARTGDALKPCLEQLPETAKGLARYAQGKSDLDDERSALESSRTALLSKVPGVGAGTHERVLKGLAALDARLEGVDQRLAAHHLPVDQSEFRILVGGRTIAGKGEANAPIQLTLTAVPLIPGKTREATTASAEEE